MLTEKTFKWLITGSVSLIILLALLASSYRIIETGNVGVKTTLGKIDPVELKPGIHFIIPGFQKIEDVFTKTVMVNYTDKPKQDTREINYEYSLKGEDKTGLDMAIDLIVEVKPVANKMADMFINVGRQGFEKKVLQPIRGVAREVLGQYQAENIMSQRSKLEQNLREALNKKFDMNPYYKLVNVQLKKIYLPKRVREAIEKVQLAKQEAKAKLQLIEANKAVAESKVELAKGEAQSIQIKAKAKADKILIEAKARAQANDLLNKSLTSMLLKDKAIEAWKYGGAAMPKTLITGNSSSNIPFLLLDTNKASK